METTWDRFRRARVEVLKIESSAQLAKALEVVGVSISRGPLADYEKPDKGRTIDHRVVAGLADLGVNPLWLLTGEGPPERTEPLAVNLLYEVVREAVEVARDPNLRDPQRQQILRELLDLLRSGKRRIQDEE